MRTKLFLPGAVDGLEIHRMHLALIGDLIALPGQGFLSIYLVGAACAQ